MHIVEHTDSTLILKHAPWVRWSMALLCIAFGAMAAGAGHFESQLDCTGDTCSLSYNPLAVDTFPRTKLVGAQAEEHPQRPHFARLLLVIADERVPFDMRFEDHREIEKSIAIIDRGGDFHLGSKPDARKGLLSFVIGLAAAIGIAQGSRWVRIKFEAGQVTIEQGGVFLQSSRVLPLSELTGVREIDGRIVMGFSNGESMELSDVQLEARRQEMMRLLKERIAR